MRRPYLDDGLDKLLAVFHQSLEVDRVVIVGLTNSQLNSIEELIVELLLPRVMRKAEGVKQKVMY